MDYAKSRPIEQFEVHAHTTRSHRYSHTQIHYTPFITLIKPRNRRLRRLKTYNALRMRGGGGEHGVYIVLEKKRKLF